jgi:EAL domain-containing protein (putative c-di-GMP-specific phosphodiesterase class I)
MCVSAMVNDSLRPRDGDALGMFAETLAETITAYEARHSVEEAFLRRAQEMLAAGGLRVALQPILELTTGRPVATEALARFPTDADDTESWFVHARRAGCGVELELDAARAALALLPAIPAGQRLSINGSPDLVTSKHFADLLLDTPMDRLIVEITEHDLYEGIEQLAERVRQLQDEGAWVAIDDAGTGYSSLQQILQLDPDIIKLDRLLVTNVDRDPMKRALASAFVTFTREAGVGLIAEGVETGAELGVLQAIGVPMAQGYFLARPAIPAQPEDQAQQLAEEPVEALDPVHEILPEP